jgi:effector-binding domain-containing protein
MATTPRIYEVTRKDVPARHAAVVRFRAGAEEMPSRMPEAFGAVMTIAGQLGITCTGPAVARYRQDEDAFAVEAGFYAPSAFTTSGDLQCIELPGVRAVVTTHIGPYEGLRLNMRLFTPKPERKDGSWTSRCGRVLVGPTIDPTRRVADRHHLAVETGGVSSSSPGTTAWLDGGAGPARRWPRTSARAQRIIAPAAPGAALLNQHATQAARPLSTARATPNGTAKISPARSPTSFTKPVVGHVVTSPPMAITNAADTAAIANAPTAPTIRSQLTCWRKAAAINP